MLLVFTLERMRFLLMYDAVFLFFFYKEVDCKRAFFGVRIRGRRLRDSSITTRLRVMFSLHASVQYHDSSLSNTLLLISL